MSKAEENSDFPEVGPSDPTPENSEWAVPGMPRAASAQPDSADAAGEWFDLDNPVPAIAPGTVFRAAGTKSGSTRNTSTAPGAAPKRTGTVLSASSTAFNTKIDALIAELNDAIICSDLSTLSETALLNATATIDHLGRHVEALQFASAGELSARSAKALGLSGLAAKKGCRTTAELLERLTGVSGRTASRRISTGALLKPALGLTGHDKPSFPDVTDAVVAGDLGIDAAEVIVGRFARIRARADQNPELMTALNESVAALVAAATGNDPDNPVKVTADELKILAQRHLEYLNPDGDRPAEEAAFLKRGFRLGKEQGGLIPISGALTPEVAGHAQAIFDAYMSPRSAPVTFRPTDDPNSAPDADLSDDRRTPDQKRHDVLATIFSVAGRAAESPRIGGAAPVVLVSVRQHDLEHGTGVGHIAGIDAPVSLRAVKQLVCGGGSQHAVINAEGRVMSLGTPNRIFNSSQRRAITLRDGGCLIPGCHIPANWCEIHHVDPAMNDGPTHTDNGVLLCWFHHHTIDTSGWLIRMNAGVPEIKAPEWLDHHGKYRPATTSGTRLSDELEARRTNL